MNEFDHDIDMSDLNAPLCCASSSPSSPCFLDWSSNSNSTDRSDDWVPVECISTMGMKRNRQFLDLKSLADESVKETEAHRRKVCCLRRPTSRRRMELDGDFLRQFSNISVLQETA
mmetsp:Transcript_18821/g.31516  ORF Transcript_18821/g.31516 Transcript_18821/m.31516 type:complete len:116 (+) Transcript_18821:54-401(+)